MIELNGESKLQARLNEEARVFAYAINPKEWKSWTPLLRKKGYLAGSEHEIKRTLILIDQLLLDNDSEQLKKLRRLILQVE